MDVCQTCPYETDEYHDLLDVHPDYIEAQNYLIEKELGLQAPRSQLSPRQIEAIKFVHGEQFRQREYRRKEKEMAKQKADELNRQLGR